MLSVSHQCNYVAFSLQTRSELIFLLVTRLFRFSLSPEPFMTGCVFLGVYALTRVYFILFYVIVQLSLMIFMHLNF